MGRISGVCAATICLAAILLAPLPSTAQTSESASFSFASRKSARATGFSAAIAFPAPTKFRELRVVFPRGARVDAAKAPRCSKTMQAANESGPGKVCPARSRIGSGGVKFTLKNGPQGDQVFDWDLQIYNARDGILAEFFEKDGNDTQFALGGRIEDGVLVLPARLGLMEVNSRGWSTISLQFKKAGTFVRTPSRCPASKRWTATLKVMTSKKSGRSLRAATPCG